MTDLERRLVAAALEVGATHAATVSVRAIRFYPEVRRLCANNACGAYGKNWMCPPKVGPLDELSARVRYYAHGVLFQTVFSLEDSFDVEGMGRAGAEQNRIVRTLSGRARKDYSLGNVLTLGAGPCPLCAGCTILKDEPCRFPEKAISSPEAYGMNVKEVVESCGLSYINGRNTVSYVGMILFNPPA